MLGTISRKKQYEEKIKEKYCDKIINKFYIDKYIASGGFCSVFYCRLLNIDQNQDPKQWDNQDDKKQNNLYNVDLAMKIEDFTVEVNDQDQQYKKDKDDQTLANEARILLKLHTCRGFPRLYFFQTLENQNIMVTQKLSCDMKQMMRKYKQFSTQTVFLIGCQLLTRIQTMHEKGFLHRDLKPQNVMLDEVSDCETNSVLYLIDFGLSMSYLKHNRQHIMYKKGMGFIGTPRYISLNAHLGIQQSRRDDLESLGYLLVFFHQGTLPWYDLRGQSPEEMNENIAKKKGSISIDELCKNMPNEFKMYMKYVTSLEFKERPDYEYIKQLFKTIVYNHNTNQKNFYFDWQIILSKQKKKEQDKNNSNPQKQFFKMATSIQPNQNISNISKSDPKIDQISNNNISRASSMNKIQDDDNSTGKDGEFEIRSLKQKKIKHPARQYANQRKSEDFNNQQQQARNMIINNGTNFSQIHKLQKSYRQNSVFSSMIETNCVDRSPNNTFNMGSKIDSINEDKKFTNFSIAQENTECTQDIQQEEKISMIQFSSQHVKQSGKKYKETCTNTNDSILQDINSSKINSTNSQITRNTQPSENKSNNNTDIKLQNLYAQNKRSEHNSTVKGQVSQIITETESEDVSSQQQCVQSKESMALNSLQEVQSHQIIHNQVIFDMKSIKKFNRPNNKKM